MSQPDKQRVLQTFVASHHHTTHITRDEDQRGTNDTLEPPVGLEPATKGHTDSQIELATRNSQLATRTLATRKNHSATRARCARCARTRLVHIRESCMGSGGGRASAYRRQHGAQGRGRWVAFIQNMAEYSYTAALIAQKLTLESRVLFRRV